MGDILMEEVPATKEESAVTEIGLYLYSVELQVQTREFKGQFSGVTKSALSIECNSVDKFKTQLWSNISDKVKRELEREVM